MVRLLKDGNGGGGGCGEDKVSPCLTGKGFLNHRTLFRLKVHRYVSFVFAGTDVDHLHLDILLGDEDADVVADDLANKIVAKECVHNSIHTLLVNNNVYFAL